MMQIQKNIKKEIKTNKIKNRQLSSKITNYNYVNHLLTNRFAGSTNRDIFNFETTLRQYNNDKELLKVEKNWKELPYKFLENNILFSSHQQQIMIN